MVWRQSVAKLVKIGNWGCTADEDIETGGNELLNDNCVIRQIPKITSSNTSPRHATP